MKKLVLALLLCMFSSAAFAVDTLEVYAFLVQFKQEKPDNSLTTGDGTFGSDLKKKDAYSLDPVKMRNSVSYWKKHFAFANAYFQAASGGKVAIKASIFPDSTLGQTVYTLKKPIIDYNRTKKMKGEKTAAYDEARSRDYLSFVYDAVMAAHSSKNSPFSVPLSKNPNTKRAYMIIHAGANKLVDGGSMGTDGADTPGDFWDSYVSGGAWEYLSPDSAYAAVQKVSKDSSVVTGLALKDAAIDTLKSIMVLSETASQDGLNWGINGFLVNQIGRELGLPNTYDVEKGISRLGYFDMMDFAGYSAGNGFMPALPNAWNRSYMGWSKVKEVRPTAGKSVSVDIAAAGSGLGTEIVKVPLNGSEYLLIENRQRSWSKDGKVDVVLGDVSADEDTTVTTVDADSIGTVFEDSICVKDKCKKNTKKAKGLILSLSSFDAGLPASGIAVWRVNEWYLRETLPYGYANAWGGDTLRDHQFGISLVEADGVLSIGKTFKNALGRDTYDYGSGTDLLPHKRYNSKSKEKFETVKTISPTGYANTKTTQGGYTGIKISVEVPDKARKEKTANAFMGDSVVNYAAPVIRVTISIDDGSIEGSKFPKKVGLANAPRGAVFVDGEGDDKVVVFASGDGTLQAMSALGDSLFPADTVVSVKKVGLNDSVESVPLYRLAPSFGPLVGIAGDGANAYSLHSRSLVRTSFKSGIPEQEIVDFDAVGNGLTIGTAVAGPVVAGAHLLFATDSTLWTVSFGEHKKVVSETSLKSLHAQDIALCEDSGDSRVSKVVVVGQEGKLLMNTVEKDSWNNSGVAPAYREPSMLLESKGNQGKYFRVACTDLDRDGTVEAIVLGSRGSVMSVSLSGEKVKPNWQHVYKRGLSGTSGLKDETSGMALGDVNGDGYPEIVFLGDNLLYALDRFGLPLPGFPVKLSRGLPVVGFFSDPLIVDVTGDKVPEILVPSSDGLVYAYTGSGKQVKDGFPVAAGSFEYGEMYEPLSIFVTDAVTSKKASGPELYAFHRDNVSAVRLAKASSGAEKASAAWALPAGGDERTGFFDASRLGDVKKQEAKKEISEFFVFPNPVKNGVAKARFEIGAPAKSAIIEFYDITGLCVYKKKLGSVSAGRNQFDQLDLKSLGSDVYTARLKVEFEGGKTKQKVFRVGIVH